jgi:hypothetical protein
MTPTKSGPPFSHLSVGARKEQGHYRVTLHKGTHLQRVIPADSKREADWIASELRSQIRTNKLRDFKVAVHFQPGTGNVAHVGRGHKK